MNQSSRRLAAIGLAVLLIAGEALEAMITTLETDCTGAGASSPSPATPVPSN
jgi:hypothetical protein